MSFKERAILHVRYSIQLHVQLWLFLLFVSISNTCTNYLYLTCLTASKYLKPSSPPCLTSHCCWARSWSKTLTMPSTPHLSRCLMTIPRVWALVSLTGATTYPREEKIYYRQVILIDRLVAPTIWHLKSRAHILLSQHFEIVYLAIPVKKQFLI